MGNESTFVFTLGELKHTMRLLFQSGACYRVNEPTEPFDKEHQESVIDQWFEQHGSDFQLENGNNRGPSGPSVLSEPLDDLRDDIESDKRDDKDLSGFFTVEDPVHKGM